MKLKKIYKHIIKEAILLPNTDFVEEILDSIKPSLINHIKNNLPLNREELIDQLYFNKDNFLNEIKIFLNILNKSFLKHQIVFQYSTGLRQININSSKIIQNAVTAIIGQKITITIPINSYMFFLNEKDYNNFLKSLKDILGHEIIHRMQADKRKITPVNQVLNISKNKIFNEKMPEGDLDIFLRDIVNSINYLCIPEEIMTHSFNIVHQLRDNNFKDYEIKKILKNPLSYTEKIEDISSISGIVALKKFLKETKNEIHYNDEEMPQWYLKTRKKLEEKYEKVYQKIFKYAYDYLIKT